eukprot:TRINITY_DN13968_c0_g1_i1.p1 TRINITY_DN13968_c0_g1~~TRINITY_DN13968_c0_g1_i1.p1  ORF type:complete len:490 (+),score=111.73 TRINITY_DN13968_c0_g1_i1:31-1500(+)
MVGEEGAPPKESGEDIWNHILSETQRKNKLVKETRTLLVVGSEGVGKGSLLAQLRREEGEARRGIGLNYSFLDVRAEDEADAEDIVSRINVWVMEGDVHFTDLLRFTINPDTITAAIAMIVLDLSRPWTMLEDLQKWFDVLNQHMESVLDKLAPGQRDELRKAVVSHLQHYKEPSAEKERKATISEDTVVLPLDDDVLTSNIGVPIIVVCAKSDCISVLEREHGYREKHLDCIQRHIRRLCLSYGATLVYTSVKDGKNIDTLHNYILHRLYNYGFTQKAQVLEKDSVLVPAGWDSGKKISVLLESGTGDDPFEKLIRKPVDKKRDEEPFLKIEAEDEQDFLARQKATLESGAPSREGEETLGRTPKPAIRTTYTAESPTSKLAEKKASLSDLRKAAASPAKPPTATGKDGAPSEDALVNFFHSLLNRDRSTPLRGKPGDKTYRKDAERELDRLRQQKEGTPSSSSSSTPPTTPTPSTTTTTATPTARKK